ncbi:MAG TPA: TetR/AcrR family transcriptional regulator, partial [Acidimicrobiia bacterium]|nr:TetR/AcrR family transcriptional regulator [Acidimicrobiia bacterium]
RPTSSSGTWQPDPVTQQQTPERLTREEKKARTRAQLIDAAATVFARRGYVAASLDEVAEEAGLTKGAVYSNFDSKEELFEAVIEDRLDEPMKDIAAVIDSSIGTTEEQAMAGARAFVGVVERERDVFLLALEMNIHVARHPELGSAFAARRREQLAEVAGIITEHANQSKEALPLPADQMAIAVEALSQGIALHALVDPDGVPDDLLGRVYALLFQVPRGEEG